MRAMNCRNFKYPFTGSTGYFGHLLQGIANDLYSFSDLRFVDDERGCKADDVAMRRFCEQAVIAHL